MLFLYATFKLFSHKNLIVKILVRIVLNLQIDFDKINQHRIFELTIMICFSIFLHVFPSICILLSFGHWHMFWQFLT